MSLLADRILRNGIVQPHGDREEKPLHVEGLLTTVPIFEASEICEYLFAGTDQEDWDIDGSDFPNLAPPFEAFWIEYRKPTKVVSEVHGVMDTEAWPGAIGIFGMAQESERMREKLLLPDGFFDYVKDLATEVEANAPLYLPRLNQKRARWTDEEGNVNQAAFWGELTTPERQVYEKIGLLDDIKKRGAEMAPEVYQTLKARGDKWTIDLYLCMEGSRALGSMEIFGSCARLRIYVGPDGRCCGHEYFLHSNLSHLNNANRGVGGLYSLFYPALLTMSFLHTKTAERVRVTPPKPLSKSWHRKTGRELLRYHTLNILPLKQILRMAGAHKPGVGLKQALHQVRGHFAEYGEEFGKGKLFGRYEGKFWIPDHIKGSEEEGIVGKDYRVKRPEVVPSENPAPKGRPRRRYGAWKLLRQPGQKARREVRGEGPAGADGPQAKG